MVEKCQSVIIRVYFRLAGGIKGMPKFFTKTDLFGHEKREGSEKETPGVWTTKFF